MTEEPIAQAPGSHVIAGPRRSYVLAVILTLLAVGLGHVYAGRAGRGLLLHILGYLGGTGLLAAVTYIPVERTVAVVCFAALVLFCLVCLADVVLIMRKNRAGRRHGYQRWWVYLLLYLCALMVPYLYRVVLVNTWVEAYIMPTGSMADTILPGDRILVEKQWLIKRPVRFGDVVAFYNEGPDSTIFVKRVVGLPGDVIEFKDEQLFRNGNRVDESYAKIDQRVAIQLEEMRNFGPLTIPDGELFMAGDDRRLSYDSRSAGTYPLKDVIGHVMTIYWSQVPDPPDYLYHERQLLDLGIDEDNPPGKIRWGRIGGRVINSD